MTSNQPQLSKCCQSPMETQKFTDENIWHFCIKCKFGHWEPAPKCQPTSEQGEKKVRKILNPNQDTLCQ